MKRSTKILIALACLAIAALVGRAIYSRATAVQQVENVVAHDVTQDECVAAERDRTAFEAGETRVTDLDADVVAGLLKACSASGLALQRPAPSEDWAKQYRK